MYKFVSVRPVPDSTQEGVMNVLINLLSPNERFSLGYGLDFNYSTLNGGLIGISPSATANNRNVFSGAERWRSTVNYNIEFEHFSPKVYLCAGILNQNELPRYFDYLGFWRTLNKVRFGKKKLLPPKL